MKPIQLHIYLPFSYWQSRDARTGVPLQKPERGALYAYLQSLSKEMTGMREDYEDCQVTQIRFYGGYLGLMDARELETLLALIHRCFSVKESCPVSGILFPGCMDMERISVYRNHHVSPLLFEVPSLLFRECERWNYPVTMQALDQTVFFLRNFHAEDLGLRIPIGIPERTENMWESICGQILHYQPTYLQFYSIAPELEEHPAFETICEKLTRKGYQQITPLTYSRSEHIPAVLLPPSSEEEYAGVGVGAISQIDGFLVQNTTDLDFYKTHCREYRELVQSVREVSPDFTGTVFS